MTSENPGLEDCDACETLIEEAWKALVGGFNNGANDLLEVYPQGDISHGHISSDHGSLEYALDGLWGGQGILLSLVLLDVAGCCSSVSQSFPERRTEQ